MVCLLFGTNLVPGVTKTHSQVDTKLLFQEISQNHAEGYNDIPSETRICFPLSPVN